MVVFIHTGFSVDDAPAYLEIFRAVVGSITGCAVPAFFFMSAMFLYRKPFSWRENMRRKIRSLLIPYLVINTLCIIIIFASQVTFGVNPYVSNMMGVISDWGFMQWVDAYTGIFTGFPRFSVLWFMRDLFVLNIFAGIFVYITDRFPRIMLCVLVLLMLFYQGILSAVCFWGFGCLVARRQISLDVVDKLNSWVICALYFALIAANVIFPETLLISRLCILVGGIFWYKFATRFCDLSVKKYLLWLSGFSFNIYIFHRTLMGASGRIFALFPTTPLFQLMQYICVPFIVVVYCVMISVFLKKYFPRFYGVITGDRKI